MTNLSAQIIKKRIRTVEQATMLGYATQKAVDCANIVRQNFLASRSNITNRDVIIAEFNTKTAEILNKLSKDLDRDFEIAMTNIGSVQNVQ